MAEPSPFLQGILIGLTFAVPVGPNALICIHRSITHGRLRGIVSGLGAATAHLVYAALSVLGLSAVSGIISTRQGLFQVIAGLVLISLGIRISLSVPVVSVAASGKEPYLKDYLSLFTIALANPLTLLFFVTVMPGYGIAGQGSPLGVAAPFVTGVFIGSALWWTLLCSVLGSFRISLDRGALQWINGFSGLLIACFGAWMVIPFAVSCGTL